MTRTEQERLRALVTELETLIDALPGAEAKRAVRTLREVADIGQHIKPGMNQWPRDLEIIP